MQVTTRALIRRRFLAGIGMLGIPVARPIGCRAATASYTLRLNCPTAADSAFALMSKRLATNVHRRSNEQITIEVYPSGQLASQQESFQALATGVIDFTMLNTGFLTATLPQFQVFDMPFLFRDLVGAQRVLDGAVGDEFFAALEPKGIIGLGWTSAGFKQLDTTTKAVVVPDDMKGLRIRIVPGPIYVATYQALGAVPVTIDLSEAFTGLSQHTIDGLDVGVDTVVSGKYQSVIRHVARLNHIFAGVPLMASKRKIESLPPDLQKIVRTEGKAVIPYQRALLAQQIVDATQTLKQDGVAFTDVQYAPFRKSVDPVYAAFASKLGSDLIERISRASNGPGR